MASLSICNCSTPMLSLLRESRASFAVFPTVSGIALAARQPLSLAPDDDDDLLYVLSASLPRLSAFSLFMRCFLRHYIFSYNIMSDLDFTKSTLSRLTASSGAAPGWAGPIPRLLLLQAGGQPSPSHTPHSGSHNTHFHIKSHPLYPQPQILPENRQVILNRR